MPNTNKMTVFAVSVFTAATTAATTLASMSEAHAQTAASARAEPEDVVKAAPATPAAGATAADPNIDRGFLLPTAMTQPAGSVTYNNYELLLHGVTVGITDRVQGSVTVLSPIVRDMPFVGFAAVKGRVLSTERFHLAVQGSLGWGHAFDVDSSTGDANVYTTGDIASVNGVSCTDVNLVTIKKQDRVWIRKYIKTEPTDGLTRVKTALRVAQAIYAQERPDLVQVVVLDENGPTLRSDIRSSLPA